MLEGLGQWFREFYEGLKDIEVENWPKEKK